MTFYEVTMEHSEETFEALARMQYNLFCMRNRVSRTIISFILAVVGVLNFSQWWGVLIMAYGCYLTTSTYSAANRTAHKLSAQIKNAGMPFPASRYVFQKDAMEMIRLPEETRTGLLLPYADICRLGEDMTYYYIFRDQFGGYMIPKAALGDQSRGFRNFLEQKSGLTFHMRTAPVVHLLRSMRQKEFRHL
ncbi:MAG: hypothetical protein VB071_09155 [Lawsonibacter sp.]|nr:hypothetical protein [Lawsonibacter sp.]